MYCQGLKVTTQVYGAFVVDLCTHEAQHQPNTPLCCTCICVQAWPSRTKHAKDKNSASPAHSSRYEAPHHDQPDRCRSYTQTCMDHLHRARLVGSLACERYKIWTIHTFSVLQERCRQTYATAVCMVSGLSLPFSAENTGGLILFMSALLPWLCPAFFISSLIFMVLRGFPCRQAYRLQRN